MTDVSEKQLARRRQVAAAVKRWRVNHREEYNKYSREYLQRPGPRAKHLARCKRYRKKRKLSARIEDVMVNVCVPTVKIDQNTGGFLVSVLQVT